MHVFNRVKVMSNEVEDVKPLSQHYGAYNALCR